MQQSLLSTSAAHGFKDYEYALRKTEDTFRIFVLGDSLAYGQGVRIDESFSKVMETMLNKMSASKVFEVINSAVPGFNAVQEFSIQKTLGVHYQPDLYLLSLCHNDAELRQPVSNDNYDSHINRIWDTEGDTWPFFEASLVRMKETAEANGAKLVVAYFVFCDHSIAPQVPEVLSKTCRRLEIPFTDTSESMTQYEPRRLWVNKIETHPNAFAHRLGAQHLVKFLAEQKFLPEDSKKDERQVIRSVLDSHLTDEQVLRSESLSFPLMRTHSLLRTKRERRAFGKQPENLVTRNEIDSALRKISGLLRRSQILECLDGYDTYLRTVSIQNQIPLFDMKQMLSELETSLFYLDMVHQLKKMLPEMLAQAPENPEAPNLENFGRAVRDLSVFIQLLEAFETNLNKAYNGSLEAYQNIDESECFLAPELARIASHIAGSAIHSNRPFGLFLAEAYRLGIALREASGRLGEILEVYGRITETDFPDADQFRRYRQFVFETADFFLYNMDHFTYCLREVNLEGTTSIIEKIANGTAPLWEGRNVELEITVHGTPVETDYSHLGILWANIVPLTAMQRDTMAIETDNAIHSYRYKFSTGVMGYFVLEFKNCNPNQVRSIRMLLNGRSVRQWVGDDIKRIVDGGMRSELLIVSEGQ
ncbi:MAG: SGNH/GDSL hydrolase family protein [Planctomycetota bacterium]|nr:SGNH/GDSL hydrolase family protein [Planctomycetota bacterium]MDA1139029.1 SGNH/GDSL hydrolase family protein [Planctomycetota bacterium]